MNAVHLRNLSLAGVVTFSALYTVQAAAQPGLPAAGAEGAPEGGAQGTIMSTAAPAAGSVAAGSGNGDSPLQPESDSSFDGDAFENASLPGLGENSNEQNPPAPGDGGSSPATGSVNVSGEVSGPESVTFGANLSEQQQSVTVNGEEIPPEDESGGEPPLADNLPQGSDGQSPGAEEALGGGQQGDSSFQEAGDPVVGVTLFGGQASLELNAEQPPLRVSLAGDENTFPPEGGNDGGDSVELPLSEEQLTP